MTKVQVCAVDAEVDESGVRYLVTFEGQTYPVELYENGDTLCVPCDSYCCVHARIAKTLDLVLSVPLR